MPESQRTYDAGRKHSAARGYDWSWRKESRAFLAKHPWCKDPYGDHAQRGWPEPATQTDHIVPHRGNRKLFMDKGNWQPLCDACHARKTRAESPRAGGGSIL